MAESPALYVVATPIGQLGDITLRALEVLKAVDWIAAEDTRHTQPLLRHHGIEGRLLAVHEHNEAAAAELIVGKLAAGQSVALVSDAGTPGISDPGARVVGRVRSAGFLVVPVPGACAAVTAMSAAGLSGGEFTFLGFLPARSQARQRVLEQHLAAAAHLILYEAPHRVLETLADCLTVFGPARRVVIAKELTKLFETFHVGPLGEVQAWFGEDPNRSRGEFVLLIEAAPPGDENDAADAEGERVLRILLDDGVSVRQASALAAKIAGASKKTLYEKALRLRNDGDSA